MFHLLGDSETQGKHIPKYIYLEIIKTSASLVLPFNDKFVYF